jgi:microcystin degradation protein MlrC
MSGPRIALAGFGIECNRFAPPATRQDFLDDTWLWDAALLDAVRADPPGLVGEMRGFAAGMDASGDWQPMPLGHAWAHPNGPVQAGVFQEIVDGILARLRAALPIDGVFISSHGAALAEGEDDPEGLLVARVRELVGPQVPVVVTLDLHANLTRRAVAAADVTIGYRTNPHIDMHARGEEAAAAMRALLAGMRTAAVLVRLPIVPPTVTMLTEGEGAFAAMTRSAIARIGGDVLNVSVFGSFPHSDTADNGIAVLATARGDATPAWRAAIEVAQIGWERRGEFDPPLTSVAEAVALAVRRDRPRIALADLGDNPGGGGRGTEHAILRALLEADADAFVLGLVHDAPLAAEAHALGVGARFHARFNRTPEASPPFAAHAVVAAVSDGQTRGRRGLLAGSPIRLGRCAALAIGGGTVVASSIRFAPNDPMCFEHLGIDLAAARTIVVKSRGHFRVGFDQFAAGKNVIEVATPGLTSPDLRSFRWRHLPRPVLPIDPHAAWSPPTLEQALVRRQ